jgi:putative component of toxin-antitoxin plasmid stabilization module
MREDIVLLTGGNKATQFFDIEKAILFWRKYHE